MGLKVCLRGLLTKQSFEGVFKKNILKISDLSPNNIFVTTKIVNCLKEGTVPCMLSQYKVKLREEL